ncbi:MAG: biotin/lipoyl-containing protein [Candidatus Kapabacteria bacterium]|nr:biotin/lipoyl-containing protein [Candidatus Kapabacteria bacterium]
MKKFKVTVNGKQYEVDVELVQDDDDGLLPAYYNQQIPRNIAHNQDLIEPQIIIPHKSKATGQLKNNDSKTLFAPLNGIVLEIIAKPNQQVNVDDVLIIIEAMKMKTNISSPIDGVIDSIEVAVTDRVEIGQLLVKYK